jgi:hypothetical protein
MITCVIPIMSLVIFFVYLSNKLPPGGARRQQHNIAHSYCKDVVRISNKSCGPNHPDTLFHLKNLSILKETLV